MLRSLVTHYVLTVWSLLATVGLAEDWPQFRGPDASGVSTDTKIPLTFGESENLRWKTPLLGAGSSSPIVIGNRVFVTCFSGKGDSLERQLMCLDRESGKVNWVKKVPAEQPEDRYQGYITEHGYASNTPVSDGSAVYVFYGKSGVFAYDMQGKQLWHTEVGKQSSNRQWGSAASLILHNDFVIVNAAEEGRKIIALDKSTGKQVWDVASDKLELAYGTPTLTQLKDGSQELLVAVPGEVWGFNPDSGKTSWYAGTNLTGNICPSVIAKDGVAYIFGGYRSSGSHAFRLGGKQDVTDTHEVWTSRNSSYVATPILHEGHLYWIDDRGQAFCMNAQSGEVVYRERVRGIRSGGRPFYASPIVAGERIYVASRWDGVFVLPAKTEYEVLAQNQFESDESDFNATPAISNGQMFIRSDKFLYCVEGG